MANWEAFVAVFFPPSSSAGTLSERVAPLAAMLAVADMSFCVKNTFIDVEDTQKSGDSRRRPSSMPPAVGRVRREEGGEDWEQPRRAWGPIWPSSARIQPNSSQIRSTLGQCLLESADFARNSLEFALDTAEVGPELAESGPNRAEIGGILRPSFPSGLALRKEGRVQAAPRSPPLRA